MEGRRLRAYMRIQINDGQYAIVDKQDYKALAKWKWRLSNGYAIRDKYSPTKKRGATLTMHKQIVDPPDGLEVDHINGNKLDNRRSNLEAVTHAENMRRYWSSQRVSA